MVGFRQLLDELYEEIAHGDQEHREWLKSAIDSFYKRKTKTNKIHPRNFGCKGNN